MPRRRLRHTHRRRCRWFSPELSILHRRDIVRDRKQLDQWECDLIQFCKKFGKANVTSLAERVSCFMVFLRNNDRHSRSLMAELINVLAPLPQPARRSITFERGPSSRTGPIYKLTRGSGLVLQSAGTVAKRHGRKHQPPRTKMASRDTDPLLIENRGLHQVCAHLNSAPRKCLRFRTPAEVFRQKLMASRR